MRSQKSPRTERRQENDLGGLEIVVPSLCFNEVKLSRFQKREEGRREKGEEKQEEREKEELRGMIFSSIFYTPQSPVRVKCSSPCIPWSAPSGPQGRRLGGSPALSI